MIPEGPALWYLNRSTGLVLLALFSLTLLLGVLAHRGDAGTRVPRFAVQALHRNLALLSTVMLALHIASAVLDEYVDIRWWQSVIPWNLDYEPWWLALGILASNLAIAVVVTSLIRERLPHRLWLVLHLGTYPAWAISVAHGLGIGTDTGAGWATAVYLGCAAVVSLAMLVRFLPTRGRRTRSAAAPSDSLTEMLR